MNTNPIICDPDSDEAKALIGKEVECCCIYSSFKNNANRKGILLSIKSDDGWPFRVDCEDYNGRHFIFIRKAEEKLSDRLDFCLQNGPRIDSWFFDIIDEAMEKLRELGE